MPATMPVARLVAIPPEEPRVSRARDPLGRTRNNARSHHCLVSAPVTARRTRPRPKGGRFSSRWERSASSA